MLAKRIIPCLDVCDGRTVKGVRFVDLRNVGDPVELGARYAEQGADELVYLDISATFEGRRTFTSLVSRIAARIDLDRIQRFLDGIPELQPLQREFYLTMLTERKEKILDYSMNLLMQQEQQSRNPELTM